MTALQQLHRRLPMLAYLLTSVALCTTAAPQLRIDTGHPWRPPFGLDRVGRPVVAVVELTEAPSTPLVLEARSKGKPLRRHPVNLPDSPPLVARIPLDGSPDELVLLAADTTPANSLARIPVALASVEADAVARPSTIVHPVDLGTIFVPAGWLLLGPGQSASIEAAAFSRGADVPHARLKAWFESKPGDRAVADLSLAAGRTSRVRLALPKPPDAIDRDTVRVALTAADGAELWTKAIPAMLVQEPPKLPPFGATALKLRYDAPISVRDPKTGSFSSLPYEQGWAPKLQDVVVSLPNGARYVFWRGSSYIPFWACRHNTGLCYEWAENISRIAGAVDCVEPLMDKELRYGRVEIVESTPARVHVQWRYQSTDLLYHVWGDEAVEDYYFYPDGFGTRVMQLKSDPASEYELSEFIVLTPQGAYPLDVLPPNLVDVLMLDGTKHALSFPAPAKPPADPSAPALYRVRLHRDEAQTAVYFNPGDKGLPPLIFGPFSDRGELVTPAYWGSHWPLARGNATGSAIDERIHLSPSHNSLMSWAARKPAPLSSGQVDTIDALGRPRRMNVRRWAWLIGMSDAPDERLLAWAKSYARPPAIEVRGARLDFDAYRPERRALGLAVAGPEVSLTIRPEAPCVNPVFELADAPQGPLRITLAGEALDPSRYAWDGKTLWLDTTIDKPAELRLDFRGPARTP